MATNSQRQADEARRTLGARWREEHHPPERPLAPLDLDAMRDAGRRAFETNDIATVHGADLCITAVPDVLVAEAAANGDQPELTPHMFTSSVTHPGRWALAYRAPCSAGGDQ